MYRGVCIQMVVKQLRWSFWGKAMVLSVFAKSSVKEIWQNPKYDPALHLTQLAVTCSKLTIETLKQSVKYVQS